MTKPKFREDLTPEKVEEHIKAHMARTCKKVCAEFVAMTLVESERFAAGDMLFASMLAEIFINSDGPGDLIGMIEETHELLPKVVAQTAKVAAAIKTGKDPAGYKVSRDAEGRVTSVVQETK